MLRYATGAVFELLLSGLTVEELAITDTRGPGFGSYGQVLLFPCAAITDGDEVSL
jgi:putative copper export protein